MGPCFLFLAAKVEENPRRLEHVLKATHVCLNKDDPPFDPKSDEYMRLQQELVDNESVLLQTLGFEVAVDHPNTYVVKCAQLVKASKELAQTAYFLATNSLHLTSFCIQYKPTVVACVCIYVACLWAHYVIPETESKNWYEFIDNSVTKKILEELSSYFIKILDSCPTRLKKRLTTGGAMVYKEGKVVAKKESSGSGNSSKDTKDETGNKSGSNCEDNDKDKNDKPYLLTSSSSISHKQGPNVKTHLTGLLKPQPHDSTPPPSRSIGSSSSSSSHHQRRHHEHRSSDPHKKIHHSQNQDQRKVDSPHINDSGSKSTPKTHEQLKIEQRKKWTPQQLEEYRKRKEKEKIMHHQRKRDAERNEIDPNTGKPLIVPKHEKSEHHKTMTGHVKKTHPNTNSPLKRQKLDTELHKRPFSDSLQTEVRANSNDEKSNSELSNFHRMNKEPMFSISENQRNAISSSGSDSDSSNSNPSHHKSKTLHSSNYKHNYEQKQNMEGGIKPLPPPPPPPRITSSSILKMHV
jgi:cyclin T